MVIPQNFDCFHWSVWIFFNLKHLAMYSSFKLYNIKLKALFRKINWGIFKYDKNTVNLIYKFSLFNDKFSSAAKTCSSSSKLEKWDAFFFKSPAKLRNHSSGRGLKASSFFRQIPRGQNVYHGYAWFWPTIKKAAFIFWMNGMLKRVNSEKSFLIWQA